MTQQLPQVPNLVPMPTGKQSRKGKEYYNFCENIESGALEQFFSCLDQPYVVKGAIMADAHKGYSLNIGGVIATKGWIVPAYVGYDIGCGLCAVKTNLHKDQIMDMDLRKKIHKAIHKAIPVGTKAHAKSQHVDLKGASKQALKILQKRKGSYQMGTLGGGNHFLEVGYDEEGAVWVVIHSGSRGTGHGIASHYMALASGTPTPEEGHFALDVESQDGKDYIQDMNFALGYALANRKEMMSDALSVLAIEVGTLVTREIFINRNHNHAELKDGLWIHRKGATHAEEGMLGVIPANMGTGSFIVEGKGHEGSLNSSSHGAGRVLGRFKAKKQLKLEDFERQMEGIVASVSKATLDESPMAYKDIHEVMRQQTELVETIAWVKPLISVKG